MCSDHFVSGSPSKLYDVGNQDWASSLNLVFESVIENMIQSCLERYKKAKKRRRPCAEVKAEVHDEPHDVAHEFDNHEGLLLIADDPETNDA